jgi:predicted regulator of Ras-like GTPase activity (Roadblock/LC7/MglB family)
VSPSPPGRWWRRLTGSPDVDPPSDAAESTDLHRFTEWMTGSGDATASPIGFAQIHDPTEEQDMSSLDDALKQLLAIEGATGAAIVDYSSGMALAQGGNPSFDLGVAAAGNSNVVRAKLATMRDLGISDEIDDILITLSSQYHLINVLNTQNASGLFIYLVLSRTTSNLALARHKLKAIAASISI